MAMANLMGLDAHDIGSKNFHCITGNQRPLLMTSGHLSVTMLLTRNPTANNGHCALTRILNLTISVQVPTPNGLKQTCQNIGHIYMQF